MFGHIMANDLLLLDVYSDVCTCFGAWFCYHNRDLVLWFCHCCSQIYLPVRFGFAPLSLVTGKQQVFVLHQVKQVALRCSCHSWKGRRCWQSSTKSCKSAKAENQAWIDSHLIGL